MKLLKNYEFHGFGFPVIFDSVPGIEVDGEMLPKVDWKKVGYLVVREICQGQRSALSGNQVKFIRTQLDMSMRDFAKWLGVVHGSVSEWEKKKSKKANMDPHKEFVLRIKTLLRADEWLRKNSVKHLNLEEVVEGIQWEHLKKVAQPKDRSTIHLESRYFANEK